MTEVLAEAGLQKRTLKQSIRPASKTASSSSGGAGSLVAATLSNDKEQDMMRLRRVNEALVERVKCMEQIQTTVRGIKGERGGTKGRKRRARRG